MKNGIIYCRVSSNEQVQGTSLDSQERACVDYAEKQDIKVKKIFIEKGESATAADRTELIKALDFCKDNKGQIDTFIVWKVDRFARNLTDHYGLQAQLLKYGTTLRSVMEPMITEGPMGKVLEAVLASFAQFENDVRKQRCTGGMQARLKEGIWPWWPPIGYIHSKKRLDRRKLHPDEPDLERFLLIQKGLRLYKEGNHNIIELTNLSNQWGLRTRTNIPMRKQLWEKILTDKFYAGILVDPWSKNESRGRHEPMISFEEYEEIQAVKQGLSNNARGARLTANPDFPLRRSVYCVCGKALTASWRTGRSKKYPYYHCNQKDCVNYTHSIVKAELEKKFVALLKKVTPNETFLKVFEETVIQTWRNRHTLINQEHDHYARELARLEAKKNELIEMRADQEISKEAFAERKHKIENQIAGIQISKNEVQIDSFDMESGITYAMQVISDLARQWQDMNIKQQQILQKLVFPEGITYDKTTEMFGTAILAPIFKISWDFTNSKSELVAGAGIEPAIFRL